MKTISSTMASHENAVCRCAGFAVTCTHRARTSEPTDPTAAPAITAARMSTQASSSTIAAAISPASARECTTAAGTMTFRCPCRSTNRARDGEHTARAIMNAAATAPAKLYEPLVYDTSTIAPRLIIEIGNRASKPAAENARAPGRERISRNGRSIAPLSPHGARAVSD